MSGLQQQDFTVLDNKVPQTILTFQAVRGREAPIEVVPVLDDVNTGFASVAYQRSEIEKFLRTDEGQLAHPMALAFLTDDGIKVQDEFSSDGNELSAGLDKSSLALHSIRRHFRQRTDQTSSMLTYQADNQFIAVGLKGRAWIDTESSQVVAMESDMLRPIPKIQLLRDHQLIASGPRAFTEQVL